MKVLLSIKPEYVKLIIEGKKKYEYRKAIFKVEEVTSVVVYATKPYGKVVGEFTFDEIIKDHPKRLWEQTQYASGLTMESFSNYFKNRDKGFAISIDEFIPYDKEMLLQDYDDTIKQAPQSFQYLRG